ncbi:MAG TPA: C25 family cysteine peptidase [Blastocatellia bacterium]|nr:C25 family cysteine peptidase [Blastocatellia bacterium]
MKHRTFFGNTAPRDSTPHVKAGLVVTLAAFAAAALSLVGISSSGITHASTTFTVTNTGDNGGVDPAPGAGTGTLRQAIVDANSTPGLDTIAFNIPDTDPNCNATTKVCTITPAAVFPAVTSPVIIDGYTQRPCSSNTAPCSRANTLTVGDDAVLLIEINGTNVVGNQFVLNPGSGTESGGSGSTLKGLIVNQVLGSFSINSSNGNTIAGNFIGTDPTGLSVVGSSDNTITVAGGSNHIGSDTPESRNVIAARRIGGGSPTNIFISSDGNFVQGNYIGTNKNGDALLDTGAFIGIQVSASGNTIGGSTPGAGNVIVAPQRGIFIGGNNNVVRGNRIGTNAAGTAGLGGGDGIFAITSNHTIGGAAAGEGNLISGGNIGVFIFSSPTGTTVVRGNLIGTDITGTLPIPNSSHGIRIDSDDNGTIGGTNPGEANTIAFNGGRGVSLAFGTGWSIRGNSIFSNSAVGIDLLGGTENAFGVTENDPNPPGCPADGDTGPNNLQNFPTLTSIVKSGNNLLIEGTLNSTASSTFTLDFYANDSCDASGNGEGKTYLGSANVMTGANCIADFTGANHITITPASQVTSGARVTATSTDANGNTSEFSACSGPTAIELIDFEAIACETGTVLQWKTGYEVDNLGFNIFLQENGNRVRINQQLIAGSALLVGPSTRLGGGYAYAWKDVATVSPDAIYWLEDIDLKGGSTWHGPVTVQKSEVGGQKAEIRSQKSEIRTSASLSDIGSEEPRDTSSRLEARAQMEIAFASNDYQLSPASRPAVKIAVKQEGWYRVTQPELVALGFDTRGNPRMLQLFVDGRELPIVVQGEKDGSFDAQDSVEFYGVGLDSPFTDSRVYWLLAGDRPGLRVIPSKSDGAPSSSQSFTATVERRDRTVYFAALRNGEKENFFGAVIATNPVEQLITISHVAPNSSRVADLEIALQGVTFSSHRVKIELNGTWVGEVTFDGQSEGAAQVHVAQSLLREGDNIVRLSPLGGQSDVSLVNYVQVSYQHSFRADGNSLKLTAQGREQISVDGFTTKMIRVFDVTDSNSPQELIAEVGQTKNGYSLSFSPSGDGLRTLLCISTETRPDRLSMNHPSSLRDLNASYVIITRRDFFDCLNPLVELRRRQGLSAATIDIDDIYDQFSFGQKTPYAVRDFLAQATNWKNKARFVLFAGDASQDPKNYLGLGDLDFVPTKLIDTDLMETSSDDWFSDFNRDGIADVATGRLPARTVEELTSMVSKILRYEQSSPSNEALLVADANNGFDFEQASAELISLIPTNLRITQVNRGRLDTEKARNCLFEALYREQFLVNYVGHGSVNRWSGNLLTNDDAQELHNEHLPIFVMMTCLNGYFHDAVLDSLGESLLKAERGGAVAVWASSGMTVPTDQALINKELYRLLFNSNSRPTLGEAVMRAKLTSISADVRRTWILLGDPAMKPR